jgi:hypothetical protein
MLDTPEAFWWLFPTIGAIGGLVGGIVGSFFSKRGEIAAIQSQINTVVSQNERLVKSSEEIKSNISQRDWSKQQRWDMQRDVAVEVMRLYGSMLRSISQLFEITVYRDAIVDGKIEATKERAKQIEDEYQAARETTLTHLTTYWQLEEVCRLVFTDKVQKYMAAIKDEYKKTGDSIWAHEMDDMKKLGRALEALSEKQDGLSKSMREELGLGAVE